MPAYRPSKLVQWEQSTQTVVANYVNSSLSILQEIAAGEVLPNQIFLLKIYKKILANNIQISSLDEIYIKERIIGKAIERLKIQNNQSIHAFKRILASEVYRFNNRPSKKYFILFPFQVASMNPPQIKSFSVYGTNFQFKNWAYIRRNFHFDEFWHEITFHLGQYIHTVNLEGNFIPVLTSSNGRDVGEAFEKSIKAFDLLRVTFNLPVQFGRYNDQIGGYPRPLGKILPSPVYGIFKNDGTFDSLMYSTNKYDYTSNAIGTEEIRSARRIARLITVPKDRQEILAIVVDAFEKYQKALDLHEWGQAFLSLWQILESITLQTEQIDMRDVISRTNNLIPQKNKFVKDLLEALRKTRNQLVHRGQFAEEQGLKEVGLLKSIVEGAINSLLSHKDDLHTKADLNTFYESVSRGDTDLKSRRKVLAYILQKRK